MASRVLPLLLLLSFALGCGDAARDRERVHEALQSGDDAGAEALLREALERHPEDVDLLLQASDFYLRADAPEFYKPRLSLHYAMRADRAATYGEPRAAAAMVRAHRGTGGFEEGDELIQQGLAGLNHPDADAPFTLQPVDPDLVEPSPKNLREQRRRDAAGPETCDDGMELVPAGTYPLTDATEDAVVEDSFCVEQAGRPVSVSCESRELRDCEPTEAAVVAGPMSGLLAGPATNHRCCAPPRTGH